MGPVSAVASCLTIACLFKGCVEAFDIIHSVQNQQRDFHLLAQNLEYQKAALYIWGETMGLVGEGAISDKKPLDDFRFQALIQANLERLDELLSDSEKLQERYGCETAAECPLDVTTRATCLSAVFDKFPIAIVEGDPMSSIRKRAKWRIRDAKRFRQLVAEIGCIVTSLQGLTKILVTMEIHSSKMISKIETIKDVESLELLSEACQDDDPRIAEAISVLSDRRTSTTVGKRACQASAQNLDSILEDQVVRLEDMTLTELKHRVFEVEDKNKELKSQMRGVFAYWSCRKTCDALAEPNYQRPVSDASASGHWTYQEPVLTKEFMRPQSIPMWDDYYVAPGLASLRSYLERCCSDMYHTCPPADWAGKTQHRWMKASTPEEALDALKDGNSCVKIGLVQSIPALWSQRGLLKPMASVQHPTMSCDWQLYCLPFVGWDAAQDFLEQALQLMEIPSHDLAWDAKLPTNGRDKPSNVAVLVAVSPRRQYPWSEPDLVEPQPCTARDATIAAWRAAAAITHLQRMPNPCPSLTRLMTGYQLPVWFRSTTLPERIFTLTKCNLQYSTQTRSPGLPLAEVPNAVDKPEDTSKNASEEGVDSD